MIKSIENSEKTALSLVNSETVSCNDFILLYELYQTTKENRLSFDLRIAKYYGDLLIEDKKVIDFEWREKEAQNIFTILIKGEVTPMCLEECVLELI